MASASAIGRPLARTEQRDDALLAAAVFVGALISAFLSSVTGIYGAEQAGMPLALLYSVVVSAPLAVRRRWPGTVAVVVATAYFLAVTFHIPEIYAGNIAMFIAFYTVGAWATDRRRAAIVRIAIIVGMLVWLVVAMLVEATAFTAKEPGGPGAMSPFVAYMLLNLLINALYFGGAYWFGERTYAARRQRDALEERTAELERERERTASQAVALDRVRIARELHDVVAHHVSLMGVQAGAARAVLDKDPAAARSTLESIEASARTALGELRQLLGTLRTADAREDAQTRTAPTTVGLDALPALAAEASTGGLDARLVVVGEPVAVAATVQVNLYRIAQEALTNARRHGGPGASADIRVRYGASAVELEVVNTGRRVIDPEHGLGMLGMRERALASGGEIELAPRPAGGFLVRVRVPVGVAADA